MAASERKIVDEYIQKMLDDEVIRVSNSEFSSAIVLVRRNGKDPRLCIDYRPLNKVTVRDRYPLPVIQDQLDKLQGKTYFTTIDLKSGFFHVPVEESSKKYTSFVTPSGQYEFNKTPFGLCNAPSIFQRFINSVFKEEIRQEIVVTYMDDLAILSKNENDAIENLKQVFDTAASYGLVIN